MKQLIERLYANTNVDAGRIRAQSTSTCTDPAQAERQAATVFRGTTQCVGLSDDLPEPGSFITSNEVGLPRVEAVARRRTPWPTFRPP